MPVRSNAGISIREKARQAKQPPNGLLQESMFKTLKLDLEPLPDLRARDMNMVMTLVRDMTAVELGFRVDQVFRNAMRGAALRDREVRKERDERTDKQILMSHLQGIFGLDTDSIMHGWYATVYEIMFEKNNTRYRSEPTPDDIESIKVISERCLSFFKKFGPVIYEGFDFGEGYTTTVSSGVGDFMTSTAIIDLRFTTNPMSDQYTLKLLMMYVMGLHSKKKAFSSIDKLGCYNPITGEYKFLMVNTIPEGAIKFVETQVLGYKEK